MGDINGVTSEKKKSKQLENSIMPITGQTKRNNLAHSEAPQPPDTDVTNTHCPNSAIPTKPQTSILDTPEGAKLTSQVEGKPAATSEHTLHVDENNTADCQLDHQHTSTTDQNNRSNDPALDSNHVHKTTHSQETTLQDTEKALKPTDTVVAQTHCPNSTITTNTQTTILDTPEVAMSTFQVEGTPSATSQHPDKLHLQENRTTNPQSDQQHLASIKPTESQQPQYENKKNTQAPAENQLHATQEPHEQAEQMLMKTHPQHEPSPLNSTIDDNTNLKCQPPLSESPKEPEILIPSPPENQNSETRLLANPDTDDCDQPPDEETMKIIKEEFQNGLDFSFNQYQEIMNKLIDTPAQPLTESQIIQYHDKYSVIILAAYQETYQPLLDLNYASVQTLFDDKFKKLRSTIRKQQTFYKRKHEIAVQKVTSKIKDCTFEGFALYDELMAELDFNTNPPTPKTYLEDHQKTVHQVVGKFNEAVSSKGLEVAHFWRYELSHKLDENKDQFLQNLSEKSRSKIEKKENEENSEVHTESPVQTTFANVETETLKTGGVGQGDPTRENPTDKISTCEVYNLTAGLTSKPVNANEDRSFCQKGPSSEIRKEISASGNTNNTTEGNTFCPNPETVKTDDLGQGDNTRQITTDKISTCEVYNSTAGSTPTCVNVNEESGFCQKGPSSKSRKEISASGNTNNNTEGNPICPNQDNINADKAISSTLELSNETENSDEDKSPILKTGNDGQLFKEQNSQQPVQADAQQTFRPTNDINH